MKENNASTFFVIIALTCFSLCLSMGDSGIEGIPVDLIDTREEAIEHAMKDEVFQKKAEMLMESHEIEYSASWYEKNQRWEVSVYASEVTDTGYGMSVYPNGTITDRGTWMV